MRCPTLKELPPPPTGKAGWPWTEESPQIPDTMQDGSPWPKVSIVTPSLNQCLFIEETIRSVLLQGYPELEYIIIDGGSQDNTIEIIKKYENWLAYWVSEPDGGQSEAVNRGIKVTTGQIVAWLNSDDMYCKNTLQLVTCMMFRNGGITSKVAYGNCFVIDSQGKKIVPMIGTPVDTKRLIAFWKKTVVPQPSVFISGKLFRENLLNENLHYIMDWDLWIRLRRLCDFQYCNRCFSLFRTHEGSKSTTGWRCFFEEHEVRFKHHVSQEKKYLCLVPGYIRWKTRVLYHRKYRGAFIELLGRIIGPALIKHLKSLKTRFFPRLSKRNI